MSPPCAAVCIAVLSLRRIDSLYVSSSMLQSVLLCRAVFAVFCTSVSTAIHVPSMSSSPAVYVVVCACFAALVSRVMCVGCSWDHAAGCSVLPPPPPRDEVWGVRMVMVTRGSQCWYGDGSGCGGEDSR